MIALLVGGLKAGKILDVREPLPPSLMFPIMARPTSFVDFNGGELNLEIVEPLSEEYRLGLGGGIGMLDGNRVAFYYAAGERKTYDRARTLEWIVDFEAPKSLADVEDKVAVEFLVESLRPR